MMRLAFIAAFVLIGTIVAGAKGSTVKLTLTGPGFAAPVEIVEPSILDRSNVFAGSFIGETVDAAPQVKVATYTVSFDVQPPQNRPVKTAYAVSVARDARTGALWLYLPGRGDAGYRLNAGTILRDGQDGHWHRPSPAWASLLMTYLP